VKNLFNFIIIFIICLNTTGCTNVKKKFIRKKKDEKPIPIITTEDYFSTLKIDELYKKHFLFWKYWQDELIFSLGKNINKQKRSYNDSLVELKTAASYLQEQKRQELQPYIDELKLIADDINKPIYSQVVVHRLRKKLEKHRRLVDKKFSPPKVKSWLIEKPTNK